MDPFIHRRYCAASFVYRLSFFIVIRIMRFDMESKEGRDVSQADQPDLFLPSESELQMAQVCDVFDSIHIMTCGVERHRKCDYTRDGCLNYAQ